MADHADLREREGDEYADDIELDEPVGVGIETDDESDRSQPQNDDAVGVGQAITALGELTRYEFVTAEHTGQHRKAAEGSIGGQEQDKSGHSGDEVEHRLEVGEDGRCDLPDDRILMVSPAERTAVAEQFGGRVLDHMDAGRPGQMDDAHEHQSGDSAQHEQRSGCIAGLGALEAGHAVGDRLDSGQSSASRGKGAQNEEGAGQAGQPLLPSALRDDLVRRALRSSERAGDLLYQADHCQNTDGGHVQIGRDGEGTARLPTPAKVEQCQDSGDADGDLDLVAFRPGHGRSQIGGSRGHGYGHSQDVVAQQCRSHEQAGMRP